MKPKTGIVTFTIFLFSAFFYSNVFPQIPSPNSSYSFFGVMKSPNATLSFEFEEFVIKNEMGKVSKLPSDTTKKKDRDGDGIVDSLDKCPDEKGTIQYDGCPMPDTDNDGIADDKDTCPTIAGSVKYNGCPPPDRDGDKINDEDDKCPDQPGVARYDGCPVGDKDGDGINEDDDKCISVFGTIQNNGCPENKMNEISALKDKKKRKKL